MSVVVVLLALALLMLVAYRGYSVILFAPVCAMLAVLLTEPRAVPAAFTGVFMEKMVVFIKLYFPVFLLGAIFGKLIEVSGYSKSIVASVVRRIGSQRAMLSIVLVSALLTYGGVSLFVVVFAVYPFAADLFRQGNIPKRLIPGTLALGAFTFTMDALPGSPQIQNIIPTTFFKTTPWAAPWLGTIGAALIATLGLAYLEARRRAAAKRGEGYGEGHLNEPEPASPERLPHPCLALLPLVVVAAANKAFVHLIPRAYGTTFDVRLALEHPITTHVPGIQAIWAVEAALLLGILTVIVGAFGRVRAKAAEGTKAAIGGALLASMNTASEYGFGAVIAALPGFLVLQRALGAIPNPLVNEAITVTMLAGVTGSASGGMSIALAAAADRFLSAAQAAHIPPDVLHRVAAMASGGMDTLPHNGAVITLLAVTGLTHKTSYVDIFAVTAIKTIAVFFVIAVYYLTGLV
ncbi:MAG TPA: GntP family permease [Planctomycetota bacterium]|nr:GntP family permease [Planctomycetota bacterium]